MKKLKVRRTIFWAIFIATMIATWLLIMAGHWGIALVVFGVLLVAEIINLCNYDMELKEEMIKTALFITICGAVFIGAMFTCYRIAPKAVGNYNLNTATVEEQRNVIDCQYGTVSHRSSHYEEVLLVYDDGTSDTIPLSITKISVPFDQVRTVTKYKAVATYTPSGSKLPWFLVGKFATIKETVEVEDIVFDGWNQSDTPHFVLT